MYTEPRQQGNRISGDEVEVGDSKKYESGMAPKPRKLDEWWRIHLNREFKGVRTGLLGTGNWAQFAYVGSENTCVIGE